MAKLYRGVCEELDAANQGRIIPNGTEREVLMRRGDHEKLVDQDGPGIFRNSSIDRYPSERNSVRSQHIQSGLNNNCFVSFTRSYELARNFATRSADGERSSGFIYIVDEALFHKYGVVAHELSDPYFPGEMEVSLRAADGGALPDGIVLKKVRVDPTDE